MTKDILEFRKKVQKVLENSILKDSEFEVEISSNSNQSVIFSAKVLKTPGGWESILSAREKNLERLFKRFTFEIEMYEPKEAAKD